MRIRVSWAAKPWLAMVGAVGVSVLSGTPALVAEVRTVGEPIEVHAETAVDLHRPALAVDADGHATVVWGEWIETTRILARSYDANAEPLGPVQEVVAAPDDYEIQYDPDVVAGRAGKFLVVWVEGPLASYDIHGRTLDGDGVPAGGPFRVNQGGGGRLWQLYPQAAAGGGDYVVGWVTGTVGDEGPWPLELGAQRVSPGGRRIGAGVRVNDLERSPAADYAFQNGQPLAMASQASGETLVVWEGTAPWDGKSSSDGGIFARLYDSRLRPLGGEVRIDDPRSPLHNKYLSAAAHPDGGFMLVWARGEGYFSEQLQLVACRFDAGGPGPVSNLGRLDDYATKTAVACDGRRRCLAAWEGKRKDGARRIVLRELRSSGEPRGRTILVASPGSRSATAPDLAAGPNGLLWLTWAGSTSADSEGVFVQRLRLR